MVSALPIPVIRPAALVVREDLVSNQRSMACRVPRYPAVRKSANATAITITTNAVATASLSANNRRIVFS
jgi:hypothetical protein